MTSKIYTAVDCVQLLFSIVSFNRGRGRTHFQTRPSSWSQLQVLKTSSVEVPARIHDSRLMNVCQRSKVGARPPLLLGQVTIFWCSCSCSPGVWRGQWIRHPLWNLYGSESILGSACICGDCSTHPMLLWALWIHCRFKPTCQKVKTMLFFLHMEPSGADSDNTQMDQWRFELVCSAQTRQFNST